MTCLYKNKQGTEILLDYAAGTLDRERAVNLELHAAECGDCRRLMDAQKKLWTVLDEVDAPEVSPDFDARLYARIAREDAESFWKPSVWKRSLRTWLRGFAPGGISWKPLAAGGAAAAVLAVGLAAYIPHLPNTPAGSSVSSSAPQVRSEAIDVEQVEVSLEDLEILMPPTASAGRM
jgi:hypothetical protein